MAKTTIDHRRKVRALEAKRDELIQRTANAKIELAKVRAELQAKKRQGAK